VNFHESSTWANYDPQGHARQRLERIRSLLPQDVFTILDAGCGNGIITNALAEQYAVTGLDPSAAALELVHTPKIQASITQIPCADRSFDLVSCNEVLEHLSTSELGQGVRELKRVADKYLLIGVPHREQLAKKQARCASCGHVWHVHGHLQSLFPEQLDIFFAPDFERLQLAIFGARERDFPLWLLRLKHRQGQWFAPPAGSRCPACGGSDFLQRSNPVTKALNALNLVLSRPRPYWLLAIFQRRT